MNCIETTNLRYQFAAGTSVLNGIDLRVPQGSIYGFLGANGAGKTTTMKLLLGLLQQQQGDIRLFDEPLHSNRISILKRTGSFIETPSLYAQLTAKENLRVWQRIYQCPAQRIDKVLELTGLSDTGKKPAGKFSLGMKQRLGIAIALLHQPQLLILDEPTNGLDPTGMIEIRDLLKTLNKESGITMLVSSHLLTELEKLVTDVGILHKGNLLFQGSMTELQARKQATSGSCIDTDNPAKAIEIARSLAIAAHLQDELLLLPLTDKQTLAKLNERLVAAGVAVYQIKPQHNNLESIFIDLTKN